MLKLAALGHDSAREDSSTPTTSPPASSTAYTSFTPVHESACYMSYRGDLGSAAQL